MRPRLLTVLATGALTLSLLGPTGAQAADDPQELPVPAAPGVTAPSAREVATDVLDDAQALFQERSPAEARELLADGGLDATMVLNQLVRVRDDLTPAERRQADALLARPTDPSGGAVDDEYTVDEETPVCGVTVCIHYVATTQDAPDMTDGDDANETPDSVDQALATAESVNDDYVAAGYRRPKGDGTVGTNSNLVDIYLSNMGNQGLYGYCSADDVSFHRPYHRAAYCGVDNDYAEPGFNAHTPLENLQVTLAHEYFHAVQFGYDFFEDPWIMEATATWAEDELYDDVNDNRQYLVAGQLERPGIPLDLFGFNGNHYGNWIFFRYLSERFTTSKEGMPTVVRDVWRKLSARSGDPDMFSTQALQSVLQSRGSSFTSIYGRFADDNRRPETTYEEGAAYDTALPDRIWTLTSSRRRTGAFQVELPHLTSVPLRYRPGSGLTQGDWRLELKVDLPPKKTAPVARVSRYLVNGDVQSSTIRLKRTGATTKTVGFSSGNVKYVELVLVNASRRTSCWRGTQLACMGRPRDNGARTVFQARAFRG